MNTNRDGLTHHESPERMTITESRIVAWTHWPVNWSAIWVGALAAIAAVIVFGLIGIAVGAHQFGPDSRIVDLKKINITTMILSVLGAFFAFVIGGWAAGKVAGIVRSEPGMLYGAIVWLLAAPILLGLAGLGAGSVMGGWYAGLSAPVLTAPYDRPDALGATATEEERAQFRAQQADYRQRVAQWREDTPKAIRNTALCTLTAMLLGLIGSVLGGWMATGEPMTLTHHRTRQVTWAGVPASKEPARTGERELSTY
jgi:hypothetical protein